MCVPACPLCSSKSEAPIYWYSRDFHDSPKETAKVSLRKAISKMRRWQQCHIQIIATSPMVFSRQIRQVQYYEGHQILTVFYPSTSDPENMGCIVQPEERPGEYSAEELRGALDAAQRILAKRAGVKE